MITEEAKGKEEEQPLDSTSGGDEDQEQEVPDEAPAEDAQDSEVPPEPSPVDRFLEKQIDELKSQRETLEIDYNRFRKQIDEQRILWPKRAQRKVLEELPAFFDDLLRWTEAAPPPNAETHTYQTYVSLRDGAELVCQSLEKLWGRLAASLPEMPENGSSLQESIEFAKSQFTEAVEAYKSSANGEEEAANEMEAEIHLWNALSTYRGFLARINGYIDSSEHDILAAFASPESHGLELRKNGEASQEEDLALAVNQEQEKLNDVAAAYRSFRSGTNKSRDWTQVRARAEVVDALQPVVDDFRAAMDRAREVDPEGSPGEAIGQLEKDIESVFELLQKVMNDYDISLIESFGKPFDVDRHEAVGQAPGGIPGTVMYEVRRGFMHGDQVLRYAQVIVAS